MVATSQDDRADDRQPDKTLANLGRRVKILRKERGLTQEDAAERAGISQSNWSKVERGAVDPSIREVLRIQMALNAPSIESFFGSFPTASVPTADTPPKST